jgi:hypothetical protein
MEEKTDKRKETSKLNIEKARLKILEQRRENKKNNVLTPKYEIDESESSGSEEEPIIMIKGGKKQKQKSSEKPIQPTEDLKNEIESLKQMILGMGKQQKKKNNNNKKKVIILQQPTQPPTQPPQQKSEVDILGGMLKRKILNF